MKHSEEFKKKAIQYVKDHPELTVSRCCKNLGIAWNTYQCWVNPEYKEYFNKRINKSIVKKYHSNSDYRKRFNKKVNKYANRNRRARKANIDESYSSEDLEYTLNLFHHRCAYCNSTDNLCIDHWLPLAKGYPLSRSNAVVLCKHCNSSKHAKLPTDHYPKIFIEWIESIIS